MAELKPAYLFTGDDEVKIDQARKRLAARAEADGAMLESLSGDACTPENFAMALTSPSLLPGHRIVLADGVENWRAADVDPAVHALEQLGQPGMDVTAVLICRKKPLKAIDGAIKGAGGELREFKPPSAKELPGWLAQQAELLGVTLEPRAAQLMIELTGEPGKQATASQRFSPKRRLLSELQKLALMVGPGQAIIVEDVEFCGSGEATSEIFALTDAAVGGNRVQAIRITEQLLAAGEPAPRIVAMLARSFGQAQSVAALVESGRGGEIADTLKMQPWLVNKIKDQASRRGGPALRDALIRIARLDSAVKGGSALDPQTELLTTVAAISS